MPRTTSAGSSPQHARGERTRQASPPRPCTRRPTGRASAAANPPRPAKPQPQRRTMEGRPPAAETEPRRPPRQQPGHERRLQRPVHHEPRIALDAAHVVQVVMDPVPVARERRVAEQHHRVRHHKARHALGRRCRRLGLTHRRPGRIAIDDVLRLIHGQPRRPLHHVPHRHEHSRPALPDVSRTASMVLVRRTLSPTCSAAPNWTRPPAHMRRGRSCTGGRNPPRAGCPSAPPGPAAPNSWNSIQCHSGGSDLRRLATPSVAANPCHQAAAKPHRSCVCDPPDPILQ